MVWLCPPAFLFTLGDASESTQPPAWSHTQLMGLFYWAALVAIDSTNLPKTRGKGYFSWAPSTLK